MPEKTTIESVFLIMLLFTALSEINGMPEDPHQTVFHIMPNVRDITAIFT